MTVSSGKTAVYAVGGADDYLRSRGVRDVIRRVLGEEPPDLSLVEFDGDSAELATVLDECRTLSLMSPIKLVVVRGADEFISKHRELLEDYVASPSPDGVLLLECRKLDARTRLTKAIDKLGGVIDCAPPKMQDLPPWVTQHAKAVYGRGIEMGAARRLVELVGDSLGKLDTEIGKLSAYIGSRDTIREADVEEMVGASRSETVFKINDAISRRDAAGALAMWEQTIALNRDAPYMAVGGLAFGIRRLVDAKRLVGQGLSVMDATKRLGMWGDPTALKRQLDRFTLRQWQDHLIRLLRIDAGAKSGLGQVEVAVEKFIVDMCAPAAG